MDYISVHEISILLVTLKFAFESFFVFIVGHHERTALEVLKM